MKGTNNIGRPGYKEVLRDNLISWLDYAFINIGGIIDVNIPSVTAYGNFHKLQRIDSTNTQFASRRGNWVWEDGYGIPISGVYINGVLTTSGYEINYRDGVVTFDSPVNGEVTLNFSHKFIEVFNAQDNNFFRLDSQSFKIEDSYFITGSGNKLPEDRIQLPAVALEVVNRDSKKGYEIGNTSQIVNSSVLLRVLSNNDSISSRIADFIADQKDTTIILFDTEKVTASGYYPLNYDGTINYSSGYYSNLSSNFPYNNIKNSSIYIKDAYTEDLDYLTPDLCKVTVRLNIESISR